MSTSNINKVLIIQTASLGDVILATALIEKLHAFFPKARIDFLLKEGYEELLRYHPHLKFVIVWDKSKNKYRNLKEIIGVVRQNRYDLVINIQRFASSGLITMAANAAHTVGFNKNPLSLLFSKRIKHQIKNRKNSPHEVERNLKLIEHLTDSSVFKPKLYPTKHDFAFVSQFKTRQYITVSPASLWFTKQWPKEKWIDFVNNLDRELTVYLLGSPKEKSLCDDIINQSGHSNALNLAGKLSFLQSAALMRDALMNYTNDSAPMHLASAMDAPVTAVFCSTVPEFGFRPLSGQSYIIQTSEQLICRPCGLHGFNKCPKKHFKCATTIKVEQLAKILNNTENQ